MKSNVLVINAEQARPEEKAAQLLLLPQLQPDDLPEQAEIERTVFEVTTPASPNWILARIAALLLPYYEKETPQAIREMEAEDWLVAMEGLPQWALENSVRWWKGAENPDRRKRPMEGDIAARAWAETRNIKAVPTITARMRLPKPAYIDPPRPPRVTPERAAEIMEKAGFAPRRFGDAAE